MTTDNEELLDDDLEDDDADDADGEDDSNSEGDQSAPSLDDVLARVAQLEATTAAHKRDITAAVGRFQSLQAKIDAGDATAAEVRALRTASTAAQEAIDALAEDEAIDPSVKARVAGARSKAAVAAAEDEKAALKARLDALEARGSEPAPTAGVSSFEQELWGMIESFDLDKNDPIFDWKGEATRILTNQGEAATRKYFTAKIREKLDEDTSTDRRQMRKTAGAKGETKPAGAGAKELDEARPLEERLKYLQSIGAIS